MPRAPVPAASARTRPAHAAQTTAASTRSRPVTCPGTRGPATGADGREVRPGSVVEDRVAGRVSGCVVDVVGRAVDVHVGAVLTRDPREGGARDECSDDWGDP